MAELEKTIKALKDWKNDPLAMNAEIDPCLVDDALSVIESLQSENKILSENCDGLSKQRDDFAQTIHEQKMEIERLREIATRDCDICANKMLKDERRWIPVTERMPEEDEDVLVFNGAECFVMALVNKDKTDVWHWDGSYYMEWQNFNGTQHADVCDVTHWMPLPQPPKEGGQG